MCGICGKLDHTGKKIDETILRKMTAALTYRGPDDEGYYLSPSIGLGHRRLSIIDLSQAGHQPMTNEDESIWLVFNGEIYDFRAHQEALRQKGHELRSNTDCEIIIHMYEEEGVECLKHLNGMFAFALWDVNKKRLWLVRDRIGIKPLHYYWDGQRIIFASEIKAILCDPDVDRTMDQEALDLYLTLNYIPSPWTIFSRIKKLEPANYILVDKNGMTEHCYWELNDSSLNEFNTLDFHDSLETGKEYLFDLLEKAIKRRLISDVPLGAFLSGGIDSSIIVALMARNSSKPVKTFSIGYKDLPSFDETCYAKEVADLHNTDHHEIKLGYKDILEAFPLVLEMIDEPFADSSAIPTFIVSRETRKHVTVALSGDGGDELFAGYRMYQGEYWSRYYNRIPSTVREKIIHPLIKSLPDARDKPGLEKIRRLKKFVRGMSNSFPERFYGWREIFPFQMRLALIKDHSKDNPNLNLVHRLADSGKALFPEDSINLMLYMDVKGLLHGDMLTKVDRMSMANSLEVRVPILDHTIVEFIFNLRGDVKLKGSNGKYLLKETFKDLLPPSLLTRHKWGFEIPIGAWFRNELRFLIHEYLDKGAIEKQGIFNYDVIGTLIDDHLNHRQDTSWHLWNLIVFQHWYKTYLNH